MEREVKMCYNFIQPHIFATIAGLFPLITFEKGELSTKFPPFFCWNAEGMWKGSPIHKKSKSNQFDCTLLFVGSYNMCVSWKWMRHIEYQKVIKKNDSENLS